MSLDELTRSFQSLKNRIKKNEGFSEKAYLDQLGFLTIGYGHLIKRTEKHLLNKKLSKTVHGSRKYISVKLVKLYYPKRRSIIGSGSLK